MSNDTLIAFLFVFFIIIVFILLRLLIGTLREFNSFSESIKYRDFTRYYITRKKSSLSTRRIFNIAKAFSPIHRLRVGFNEIQDAFRTVSKEKETHYQYLQTVLEVVDTGILAYERESGKVMWMNDALKDLIGVPYIKTIESLKKRDSELYHRLAEMNPGERSIITIKNTQQHLKVMVSSTGFRTGDILCTLLAFQNVHEALDETESQAWQRLLSVMTHEIMNSVAPIASLAGTLQKRVKKLPEADSDQAMDIILGIETIRNRSEALLRFAEVYRSLYKVTAGRFTTLRISELFNHIHILMEPKFEQLNISSDFIMKDPLLEVKVDRGLIEQVLINLMLNAMDAIKEVPEPRIKLTAYTDNDNRVMIKIADNGTGISDEVMEKIFIPFFSTKKNGNGIGLPLSKQIMQIHKGSISIQSVVNQGTAVFLRF